jgi:hypothetical protein
MEEAAELNIFSGLSKYVTNAKGPYVGMDFMLSYYDCLPAPMPFAFHKTGILNKSYVKKWCVFQQESDIGV